MLAALAVVSLALAPPTGSRSYAGPEAVTSEAAPGVHLVALHHTAVAAAKASSMPRYFPAPLSEAQWQQLSGRRVLVILGTAGRECVTLTGVDKGAIHYVHPQHGTKQAPLGAVTAVHENSWECVEGRESTPSEWARVGAGIGVGFSAVGLAMGVLRDAGAVKHFTYASLGLTTTLLGTPIVAIGGASTSRDLRVRGRLWARGLGYALYAGAVVFSALWLVGQYGDKAPLQFTGITSIAGGLGVLGSTFMAVDALSSRAELKRLELEDTGQAKATAQRASLHLGAGPSGHGFAVGLGGRF